MKIDLRSADNATLEVLNHLGQVVFSKQLEHGNEFNETINTDVMSSGIYFVKVQTSDAVKLQKIVVR